MATATEAASWARDLDVLAGRIGPRFCRPEARERARRYLAGLLAPLERKNGWHLAEAAGDASPDSVQDFLARMRWDADAVRDDLQAYVVEHLGDPDAVLVLDETGFLKKGERSVGVQRQYSGTAGRIENCQIGVFLGYAGRHGYALIDRALYLPQGWAADEDRRLAAWVPETVAFATKPKLGLTMLKRALDAGVPCAWVAGDSVYGTDSAIRRELEHRRVGYVLTVTSGQRLWPGTVSDWIEEVPADGWQRLSAGDGAKGPRLYDWARLPFRGAPQGWSKALLIRRRLGDGALTFYLTHAPEGTALADLVRVAGARWTIESSFEMAKGEVGLDHYEVRSWTGWQRHITLAMLAFAFLTVLRKAAIGGRGPGRLGGRLDPPDRTRNSTPASPPPASADTRHRRRYRLVTLAKTSSTASKAIALETTHTNR
ncbi:IS701 family transposase [Azospirillum picis]|uniref:SRSO17 transposase n=1 Tax=Azospirillum picis TaxID=488438 RepID=A0ABU0MVF2_9PROT|nr:IS701 family transposase [Azospirillum picis]MBP2303629.1 SRSO17 transposase [Azospirillum picis]MDQ0537470.1 SRSO17 transposase [Azospirillum picis]